MDETIAQGVNLPAPDSVYTKDAGTNPDEHSDEVLARKLQAGEEWAFDVLVHRHQARLYGVAYRLTGCREDALDVTQEALLKAYRRISAWRPTGKFGAWLTRLTVNQAIDGLRRNQRRPATVPLDGQRGPELETSREQTALGARGAEIDARIQLALLKLSPSQRAVFTLRHYEGHTLAEIAPVMGCTVGSVKVHLFRAMKKMRTELSDLRDEV